MAGAESLSGPCSCAERLRLVAIAALVGVVFGLAPAAASAVCDITWDGEKLARIAREHNVALKTSLLDKNKNVVAELRGAQILAIAEAKDGIAKQLGRSSSLVFCSDKEPNAFATVTPHGEVVAVTVGLAQLMDGDRDMAAFVIGHEYGHLVLEHQSEKKRREEFLALLEIIGGIYLEAKVQMRTHVEGVGVDVAQMGTNLFSAKFDRDQERAADQAGFKYMVEAGFNPLGAIRVADRMQQAGPGGIGLFFDDHPGWSERNERFRKLINTSPAAQAMIARTGSGTTLTSATPGGGQTQVMLVPVYETSDAQRTLAEGIAAIRNNDFQAGVTAVRSSAATGYAPAQTVLAYFYMRGLAGVPQDEVEAVRLYRLGAAQGNALARNNLASMYEKGSGDLSPDPKEALRLFREAADQGVSTAEARIGSAYLKGELGLTADYRTARGFVQRAADAGNADGLAMLGIFYENGWADVGKDLGKAVALYRQAADKGNAIGEYLLGTCYELGKAETPKDLAEAVRWYRLAAFHGSAPAQNDLGVMYVNGRGGLSRDAAAAAKLFRQAAAQDFALAQANLGAMYLHGEGGLTRDPMEAGRLFRRSADKGIAVAQANLGLMYFDGEGGLPKSPAEALRLYRMSAAQGNALGEFNLGAMYEYGDAGLPKDRATAVTWYRKAAAQGLPAAIKVLGDVASPAPQASQEPQPSPAAVSAPAAGVSAERYSAARHRCRERAAPMDYAVCDSLSAEDVVRSERTAAAIQQHGREGALPEGISAQRYALAKGRCLAKVEPADYQLCDTLTADDVIRSEGNGG
jgi:TPR repeat protein